MVGLLDRGGRGERITGGRVCVWVGVFCVLAASGAVRAHPWADQVVSYSPGTNAASAFTGDAAVVLGAPQRMTGELTRFPGQVSSFSAPFGTDEILSIGAGGELVVRFAQPVVDNPSGVYFGIDLLVFGNAFFLSNAQGRVTDVADEPGSVQVSQTGEAGSWHLVEAVADALFPTEGYTDASGPFASDGVVESVFTRPVDPGFDPIDKTYAQILEGYGGSGGGAGIDFSSTSLPWIQYVRVSQAATDDFSTEIDAFADVVPEPAAFWLLAVGAAALVSRRRAGVLIVVCAAAVWAVEPAGAQLVTLIDETFEADPVTQGMAVVDGDGSRFSHASSAQSLTASYDSSQPTSKLIWPLGATLTADTSFRYRVGLTLQEQGFFADPEAFAQIAFGLINSATTGANRSGGPEFSGVNGSAYDVVTVDYFPNVTDFGGPTLGPSVVQSDQGGGFFGSLVFPFGDETDLTTEGSLPLNTAMTAEVDYDAALRLLTLRMAGTAINTTGAGDVAAGTTGGPDGEVDTIQSFLPNDVAFSVDSFALTLWEDEFRAFPNSPSVAATVVFDSFHVAAAVPEPTSVIAVSVLIGLCLSGRRGGDGCGQGTACRGCVP